MAVVQPTMVYDNDGCAIITWTGMTTSDTGGPVDVSRFQEKTFHNVSAGGGTAQIQGSNDGTNYVSIGSAVAAGTLTQISVNPKFIQIGTVATATVTVILVARPGGR